MISSFLSDHIVELILLVSVVCMIYFKWRQSPKLNLPPGPQGWPLIGNLPVLFKTPGLTNDDYYFTKCAKQYGDIYKLKFGSDLVFVLCNVDYVREAFNDPNLQDRPPPVSLFKAYGKDGHGIVFAGTAHNWKLGRQFASNLFRDLGVGRKGFHNSITSEVIRLSEYLDSRLGQPLDNIHDQIYISISNVINAVVFGKQFDYNDKDFKKTVSNNIQMVRGPGPSGIIATSSLLCAFPFGPGKRLIGILHKSKTFLIGLINECQQNLNVDLKPTTFVDAFLIEMQKSKSDPIFQIENLVSSCNDLFVAGTDTTASTLAFAILFLVTHPRVQDKCRKELDDILGNEGVPDYSEKSKFHYLQAIIQETERLSFVVPLGLPHVAESDQKIFGYDCPKGTKIVANMGSIFMNAAIFENPKEFKPERFIKDGCFQKSQHVIPFSVGKRVCIGEQLSRMEAFLYLSYLLRSYSFHVPDGVVLPDFLEGMVGLTRKPMPFSVIVQKRSVANRNGGGGVGP